MAVQCAQWSNMAYASSCDSLTNASYVECDGCDADCVIFDADKHLVIAVRGTTSKEDMFCDVHVVQTLLEDIPDVLVHSGFNMQYKALSSVVNQRVMKHLVEGGSLICTGHSLGAGVAALFAVSYGIRFPQKVSYYGFGSPRQGNRVFKQLMASTTLTSISVKNQRDPVCASIPSVCLPSRYEHAGLRVCIGTDPFPYLPNILFLRDHDIAEYITHLEETMSGPEQDKPVKEKRKRVCDQCLVV